MLESSNSRVVPQSKPWYSRRGTWHLVVNCEELIDVDPNCPWQPPQSRAYIGPNLRAARGNKLGVRPSLDHEEQLVNEIMTGG
jgi:hypothetical protein